MTAKITPEHRCSTTAGTPMTLVMSRRMRQEINFYSGRSTRCDWFLVHSVALGNWVPRSDPGKAESFPGGVLATGWSPR